MLGLTAGKGGTAGLMASIASGAGAIRKPQLAFGAGAELEGQDAEGPCAGTAGAAGRLLAVTAIEIPHPTYAAASSTPRARAIQPIFHQRRVPTHDRRCADAQQ